MTGLPPDVGVFLERLVRLDPAALVRIRTAPSHVTLWGRVPWDVLVSRTLQRSFGLADDDVAVRATDWLAAPADVGGLNRVDAAWRAALPPAAGRAVIEEVPASTVRSLGAAAAETLRSAATGGVGGRAVGSRAVRDALLDHVAIVVSEGERQAEIPQRLIQATVRMSFVADGDDPVRVLQAGTWIGLAATYGTAWWRPPAGLSLMPTAGRSAHK